MDDSTTELTETFNVNLSNHVGATIAIGQGVATILDNDPIVLTRSVANVTGNVLSTLRNSGTWSFPQSQNDLVTLTASLGDVVKNANGTWSWSMITSTKLIGQQITITANYGTNNSSVTFTVDALVAVSNRQVYYKGSSFASIGVDNSLDPNKVLAQSGAAPQTLSYSNLINTTRGINGIVLDVAGLASASLTAGDFTMRVSPTGFFDEAANPPSNWATAPAPTGIFVTPGTNTTPARVRLEWADNAIENRWLQIRILANANTGLVSNQVYYLGHLQGEINGQTIGGAYFVNNADLTAALPVGQVATVGNTRDVDKNGFVLNADFIIIRLGIINGLVLRNITIPTAGSADEGGFGMRPFNRMSPSHPTTPIFVAAPIFDVTHTPVEQPLVFSVLDPAPSRLDQLIPQTGVTARRGASADEDPVLQHITQTKADGKLVGLVDDFFANLGRQRLIPNAAHDSRRR